MISQAIPRRLSNTVSEGGQIFILGKNSLRKGANNKKGDSCRNCLTIWKYNLSSQALLPMKRPWLHRRLLFVCWSRPWQMRMNPSEKPPQTCWQSSPPRKRGCTPRAPNHKWGQQKEKYSFSLRPLFTP